ncbi:hypothetical protein COT72_00585 [archaeon CG10_big_fil_rev_8_21_14_0_10_43_11]|nr:MAG: hypothetical protein COT72_00585 [archaeon CG10_big_fil_rev_8_21_14_0_10_43_11]
MKHITSIDLFCIVRELQALKDARVEKIYQPKKGELLFVFHHRQYGKIFFRIISGVAAFFTKSKKDYTNFPPHFCMFLRKHLRGASVKSVKQRREDRIIEIHFETKEGPRILVSELFSPGNVLLCEGDYKIIALQHVQIFNDRKLIVHKVYEPPEPFISGLSVNSLTFKRALMASGKDTVVKALASSLGLGGKYAEELCARAHVLRETPLLQLGKEEYDTLYKVLDELVRLLKYKPYNPFVILESGKPADFSPAAFEIYANAESKKVSSFNEALDEYYTHMIVEDVLAQKQAEQSKQTGKFEAIHKHQVETVRAYGDTAAKKRESAQSMLSRIDFIESIRNAINSARDRGDSWSDIEQKLENDRKNGIEAAKMVKQIDPVTKEVILDTEPELRIALFESAGKQLTSVYEQAKKLETKAEIAQEHAHSTQQKIEELRTQPLPELASHEVPRHALPKPTSVAWFEQFKHFYTSQGHLVVCGKDADTNELLIKRYMNDSDIVFHADIFGSPFGLLQAQGEQTPDEIVQAAIFVGSHSRVWREGLGTTDVYWVEPSQVAKEGGLQKGSFMIYGRRNYVYTIELELAIGIVDGAIISGPKNVVAEKTAQYMSIVPGHTSQHDTALKLKEVLHYAGSVDDFVKHIPAGSSDLREAQPRARSEQKEEHKPSNTPFFGEESEEPEEEDATEPELPRYGSLDENKEAPSFFDESDAKKNDEDASRESESDDTDSDDFFFNGFDELQL